MFLTLFNSCIDEVLTKNRIFKRCKERNYFIKYFMTKRIINGVELFKPCIKYDFVIPFYLFLVLH